MKLSELKYLIREIYLHAKEDVQRESDDDALYVEYIRDIPNEKPFKIKTENGLETFQYVMAKYPSGKQDIGVYAQRGDLVYGLNSWRTRYRIGK